MCPTVLQHYAGSTSTPPRVARLYQFREASLVTLSKFYKIYACSVVSIVRLVHFTIRSASNSSCHSFPSCQLPGELVSVPIPNIDLNLYNRSRPSAFVPMSLGSTSVLTADIVSSFPNTKS